MPRSQPPAPMTTSAPTADVHDRPAPSPNTRPAPTARPEPRPAVTLGFSLGELYATPEALAAAHAAGVQLVTLVLRHLACDWGDTQAAQAAANDKAVTDGGPLRSIYSVAAGDMVVVVTNAARTRTIARLASQSETDR